MQFFDVIDERRSVRKFLSKEIEEKKVQKLLEVINAAPSAGNCQAYEIVLVRNKEKKRELAHAAYDQDFINETPVVLVFCANPSRNLRYGKRGTELYAMQDATIACTFAMLAAIDLGLASVWVGAFDDNAVADIINIKNKNMRPVAILPVGYADETPKKTSRRKLSELIHDETL